MNRMPARVALIAFLLLATGLVRAADPTSSASVTDPATQAEIDKADDQAALSKARAAAYNAQAEEEKAKATALTAGFPSDKPTYPQGDIKFDQKSGDLAIWAGGLAVQAAASQIASEFKGAKNEPGAGGVWLMSWSDYRAAITLNEMSDEYYQSAKDRLCDAEDSIHQASHNGFLVDKRCPNATNLAVDIGPAVSLVNVGLDAVLGIASKFNADVSFSSGTKDSVSTDDLFDAIVSRSDGVTYFEPPCGSVGGAVVASNFSWLLNRAKSDAKSYSEMKSAALAAAKKSGAKDVDTSTFDNAIASANAIATDVATLTSKDGSALGPLQGIIRAVDISYAAKNGCDVSVSAPTANQSKPILLDVAVSSQAASLASYKRAFGARKIVYVSSLVSRYRFVDLKGRIVKAGLVAVACEVTHAVGYGGKDMQVSTVKNTGEIDLGKGGDIACTASSSGSNASTDGKAAASSSKH